MGELLRDALTLRPVTVDLVMPVPLAPARLRERGFNQAALLAAEVVGSVGAELRCDGLVREARPPQSRLSGEARRLNVRGSISMASDVSGRIAGRRVLLVDDVVTTGATLSACADALKLAGATHIQALAFARDL
jgi:ComF family protein